MNHRSFFAVATLGALLASLPCSAKDAGAKESVMNTSDTVTIFTTAQGTDQRLGHSGEVTLKPGHPLTEAETSVFVNPGKRFQPMLGIGGAITDSSAEVFAALSPPKPAEVPKG